MAISQSMCTSFKVGLLNGVHNFSVDTFKMALYSENAQISASTTIYTTDGEISAQNYSAGGIVINVDPMPLASGTTAYVSFQDAVFNAALTARGALIYNQSKGNAAVAVLDFGADKTMQNFTVVFPPATANSAILRIA
jgi:hypothetical protein